jgi:glycosyltransferase involved in cell wall biosynthesis
MQITFLNTYDKIGGAAIACKRLWEALKAENANVHFLAQQGNPQQPLAGIDYLAKGAWGYKQAQFRLFLNKAYLSFYDKKKGFNFTFDPAFWGANVAKHPLVLQSDILHLHWINHGFLSLSTLKAFEKLKKKLVWTLHDMWPFTGGCFYSERCDYYKGTCGNCFFMRNPGPKDFSHTIWKKKQEVYAQLDLTVVACSRWLSECAAQSSLFREKRVLTIPSPLNTNIFFPRSQSEIRHKLHLPQDKHLLLFTSAKLDDPRKGFIYLKKTLARLQSVSPTLSGETMALVLLGKRSNKVEENIEGFPVYYLGNLDNETAMAEAYSACNIFVNPSLADNLPNTIVEAMACGVPVVAFASGGIPEMMIHQESGYLAPPTSVEGLAAGIEFLLSFPERYEKIQQAAVEFVRKNYNYSTVAKRYLSLYQEITTTANN